MKQIIIFLALFLITSCDKDDLIDITDQCEFIQLFTNSCFQGILGEKYDEIVIREKEDFLSFVDSIRNYPANLNCDTAVAPYIDFDEYVLVGTFTSGGGCRARSNRKVFQDMTNEEIIYQIKTNYTGWCLMLITSQNWVLIPKSLVYKDIKFSVSEK